MPTDSNKSNNLSQSKQNPKLISNIDENSNLLGMNIPSIEVNQKDRSYKFLLCITTIPHEESTFEKFTKKYLSYEIYYTLFVCCLTAFTDILKFRIFDLIFDFIFSGLIIFVCYRAIDNSKGKGNNYTEIMDIIKLASCLTFCLNCIKVVLGVLSCVFMLFAALTNSTLMKFFIGLGVKKIDLKEFKSPLLNWLGLFFCIFSLIFSFSQVTMYLKFDLFKYSDSVYTRPNEIRDEEDEAL